MTLDQNGNVLLELWEGMLALGTIFVVCIGALIYTLFAGAPCSKKK